VFKVGKQPINSRIEADYNVVRPDGAPDWQIAFTWQFLFPKQGSNGPASPCRSFPAKTEFLTTDRRTK
jgi:hypothetical protein